MSKKKISIKDILKGKFLVEDGSFKNWKVVIYLVILSFISIISSHWADRKVVQIRRLQTEVSNLKSEYAYVHKQLMQNQMRSHVEEVVAKDSIFNADEQPYILTQKK